MNNVIINSNYKIDIAEEQKDDTIMKVKFIICDFNINRNGTKINRNTIENWLSTLVGKPLVGKIKLNKDNEEDFGSHEANTVFKLDENGHLQKTYKFDTDAFGTFTSVQIEKIDNEEYITAEANVWKRFSKTCELIQKRFDDNLPLGTSWEIEILDKSDDGQVKVINDGIFFGLALLGKYTTPAYESNGNSLLEVAEKEQQNIDELSEAFIKDIIEISELEQSIETENSSVENKINNEGGHLKMAEENKIEISSLTMEDLYTKVRKAICKATTDDDKYYYISYLFPIEFRAIVHSYEDEDNKFVEFTYSISENGDVSITGQKEVEMVFKPKLDVDAEMSEINSKLSTKENELSQKVDEIVKLGETIQSLNSTIAEKNLEISELEPVKAELAEKKAKEEEEAKCKKKAELSEMMVSSKYFTSEELSSNEEIANALENLDEATLKTMIADKVIESAEKAKEESEKKKCKAEKEVEKSAIEVSEAKVDLNAEQNYDYANPIKTLFKSGFFNK